MADEDDDGGNELETQADSLLVDILSKPGAAAGKPVVTAPAAEGADKGVVNDDAAASTEEDDVNAEGTDDDQPDSGQPESPRVIEESDLEAAKQEGFREAAKFLTQQLAEVRNRNGEPAAPVKEEAKDPVIALAEVPFADIQREQKRLLDMGQNIEAEMLVADYRSARMVATERKARVTLEGRLAALESGRANEQTESLKSRLDVVAGARNKWEPLQETVGELILMDNFRVSQGLPAKYGGDANKLYRAAVALRAAETGKGFSPSVDAGKKAALGNLPGRTAGRGQGQGGNAKPKVSKEEALVAQMAAEFDTAF